MDSVPPLVAHLLHQRGIRTGSEAEEFLSAADSLFEDPATLPDVDAATARIAQARDRGETAAVFGDFDADGVTGTALMVKALSKYGLNVVPYIPHRVREGHGLNDAAVDSLAAQGVRLIVTVDCGVSDVAAVAHACTVGIDTVVTDHHLVSGGLPEAAAVINPHAAHSGYGFDHLTGVGMTLKLSQALLEPQWGPRWSEGLMELAAIGTITDMAPLLGENRFIVRRGLEHLSRTSSEGLLALMRAARVDPAHVNAENVGFAIGPRLNAAGRLDHADIAYDLLVTEDRSGRRGACARAGQHEHGTPGAHRGVPRPRPRAGPRSGPAVDRGGGRRLSPRRRRARRGQARRGVRSSGTLLRAGRRPGHGKLP